MKNNNKKDADLQDVEKGRRRPAPEKSTIDLPDEHDPVTAETQQTAAALEDATRKDHSAGTSGETDLTEEEKAALDQENSEDEENLRRARLDDTDFEGDKLNEADDVSGDDLDVPGEELDDDDENTGEEDEENNAYSQSDNR